MDNRQQQRGRAQRAAGVKQIYLRPEPREERHQWTVAHEIGEHFKSGVFARGFVVLDDDGRTLFLRDLDGKNLRLEKTGFAGAHSFLVDDYGIRLAVSETKGHRDQAESLIYKPIAPIDPDTAKTLAADKRFGTKTPDQLVIDPLPTLKSALEALPKGTSADATFAYGGGSAEQRGVVTRLVTKPWGYVLAVPLTTYTKAADNATFDAVLMLVMGVLLSFVIGVVLTRSLVGPLRRLVGEATQVSTGDIDLREAKFDTRSGDDITHEVASAFDRMLNALRFYALADEAGSGGDD